MSFFHTFCYALSLVLGFITIFTAYIAFKKLKNRLRILPRGLRLYLWACALPFAVVINLSSIWASISYLFFTPENAMVELMRSFVTFSSQQLRNSLFVIVIERTIATIYLEKYKLSSKISLFWYLTIYSYGISSLIASFAIMTSYVPSFQPYSVVYLWIMFLTHVITLVVGTILYVLNTKMYKVLAYQTTLQCRYQIFENIKVLSFIFPQMLIFTLIAPFGSVITIISRPFYTMPYSIFHIFYNISFLLILIQQLRFKRADNIIPLGSNISTIAMHGGKLSPMAVKTGDNYFQQLQTQWL